MKRDVQLLVVLTAIFASLCLVPQTQAQRPNAWQIDDHANTTAITLDYATNMTTEKSAWP